MSVPSLSNQSLGQQDLLVLVEGSFAKSAHLNDFLVYLARILLDKRKDTVLCSQFTHTVQEQRMHKIVQKQVRRSDLTSAVQKCVISHKGLDVVLRSRAALHLIVVQFKRVFNYLILDLLSERRTTLSWSVTTSLNNAKYDLKMTSLLTGSLNPPTGGG
jgi:hypothetical protein